MISNLNEIIFLAIKYIFRDISIQFFLVNCLNDNDTQKNFNFNICIDYINQW